MLNETHSPALKSWLASANNGTTDFPLQNLPHGVFRRKGRTGASEAFRGGVAIGDQILDMAAASATGVFTGLAAEVAVLAGQSTLNGLMAQGQAAWSALRLALSRALREAAAEEGLLRPCLVPQSEAEYAVPAQIGDYSDFFASYAHMVNMGRLFQPDNPEIACFKWLPIAYHGRASSIEVSGTPCQRPLGQARPPGAEKPSFGPTKRLDYEMELGFFVGPGNERGKPIAIDDASGHIFGACLLNDWSARDVQGWEAVPLGPFLAKSFLSTVSPWIVTMEALAPYRTALPRLPSDPPTFAHLLPKDGGANGGLDIQLQVSLQTAKSGATDMLLSRNSAKHSYWSFEQMLTHHTEGGCNLRPGDLLGTGTQSGPERGQEGCLMERSVGGREPLALPNGETRSYLEDGDTVVMRGWCERDGCVRIGFGECVGTVLPALVL